MLFRTVVGCMLIVLAGCATGETVLVSDPLVDIAWPSPPNRPRIKFLRWIKGPEDIVPPKGKFGQFVDMMTGDSSFTLGFSAPYGLVSDGETVLYVADPSAGIVHRYDLVGREVDAITKVGEDVLASPVGVALSADGELYITDSINAKVYKLNRGGEFLRELKVPTKYLRPAGIAINRLGEKFVVDVLAHKLYVFNKDDEYMETFPKSSSDDELDSPTNVAVDQSLNVYITDSMNFMVKVYDHEGNLKRSVGQIGDSPGSFARPRGVAVDSDLDIYVVDAINDNFQVFNQEGQLLLFVGKNGQRQGEFSLPSGICIDKKDRIFIADTHNHRIQLFQYLKEGVKQ